MGLRDFNDFTAMTRAQLADRIRQMQATQARNTTLGAPGDRHRPMEDRRRGEKIATYQRELDRRIQYDADQAAADARTERPELPTAYRSYAPGELARSVGPSDPPCTCHLSGDAANAIDCAAHNHNSQAAADARAAMAATEEPMNAFERHAHAEPSYQEWIERNEQADTRAAAAAALDRHREPPSFTVHTHAPIIEPPPSPRLAVPCPQCHAEPGARCTNYKGQHCHPHGARKLPDAAAADIAQAKARAAEATATRRATVASIRRQTTPDAREAARATAAELPDLDRAVEALVREHTSGAVIEAAWKAAHRLFHPEATR